MTKKERAMLAEFLRYMRSSIGQNDQGDGDKELQAYDKREWELFNALTALTTKEK